MGTAISRVAPQSVQSVHAARADLARYQQSLIKEAATKIADVEQRLLKARAQLDDAERDPPVEHERAQEIADRLGLRQQVYAHGALSGGHLRSLRRRVILLSRELEQTHRFRKAVEAGHLPMPRLPAVRLEHANVIPVEALESLEVADASGLFDEFRVIDGRDADTYGTPRRDSRLRAGLDPILVGLIGREMFPLAWWR